ncbi:MAG: HAMP domain-containing histidine kinase [Alphaproteobacteria bacterium]|nr:HAMP domain-containing histidine kinase [Alphaproteobacteria bacterium]
MLLVFSLGLGGALTLRPLEDRGIAAFGRYGSDLLREPYQDLLVLVPFGLAAIALIWLVSGWSLRHLASASREAAAVDPSNPGVRISTEGLPGEIRPLVNAVNGALDRLGAAYESERRFVADAAHELRTPLAVLGLRLQRAKLDNALDWVAIDEDVAKMNRLVGQLLDLARKEHMRQDPSAASCPVVNLSRIAREAAAAIVPLAEKTGRVLEVALPASLSVRGRPDDLRDMIRNVLENAIVHGEGRIRLAGQFGVGSGGQQQAWITVSDEGPGVPVELREEIFDRFRKARPDSAGHGLGLAIVREVVRSHGGSISFLTGPGCRIQITVAPALGTVERMPRRLTTPHRIGRDLSADPPSSLRRCPAHKNDQQADTSTATDG